MPMRAAAPTPPLDLDGFLDWEERQQERYELAGGVVRMMAGGTEDHDRIGLNIAAALRTRLRGKPCSAHGSNLKLLSRSMGASMYPDVFVRCGPREGGRTRTDDAVIVFEVLSEGTAQFDLTRKRMAYEAIPTLRRIVYVSTVEARLDVRVRGEDGLWRDEPVEGLAAEVRLPEIDVTLTMAEIYEDSDVAVAGAGVNSTGR
jgi:Uma2 family endonuclease